MTEQENDQPGQAQSRKQEAGTEQTAELRRQLALQDAQLRRLGQELAEERRRHEEARALLAMLLNSRGWRLLNALRALRQRLWPRRGLNSGSADRSLAQDAPGAFTVEPGPYARWLRHRHALRRAADAAAPAFAAVDRPPLLSVLMPVYGIPVSQLKRAVEAVRGQRYDRWELTLCAAGETDAALLAAMSAYTGADSRIRVQTAAAAADEGSAAASAAPADIAVALNEAIRRSSGEWLAFCSCDGELSEAALQEVAAAIARTGADALYADEDVKLADGERREPFFKPDWSPDYLGSTNYLSGFAVYRRSLEGGADWVRPGGDGADDYDLALRMTERAASVAHVPRVLFHAARRRVLPDGLRQAEAIRALEAALARRGERGEVKPGARPGIYTVRRTLPEQPLVSVIIPSREKAELLRACLRSLFAQAGRTRFEIIVVDNGSTQPETLRLYDEMKDRITLLSYTAPFNYSAMNNEAVRRCRGSVLLFLNNDTEATEPGWLEAMLAHALRPNVAAVGAKLLYPDGRVQHAGVFLGIGGIANHMFVGARGDEDGYAGLLQCIRNCSAVTGACMMMRREVFEQAGGFNEAHLPVAYNDVELCLRLSALGYVHVWTPEAVLVHHESATRSTAPDWDAVHYMEREWGEALARDRYYNPNFDKAVFAPSYHVLTSESEEGARL